MNKKPSNVCLASTLAIIGGLVAVAYLAAELLNVEAEGTFIHAAVAMLVVVLFFATAGFLSKNGKGEYYGLIIIAIINIATCAAVVVMDPKAHVYFGCVLMAFAIVVAILVTPKSTYDYLATRA